jgi:hypothetical protein
MDLLHITTPLDPRKTLCGQASAMVAAVSFAECWRARGCFCNNCVEAAQEEKRKEQD